MQYVPVFFKIWTSTPYGILRHVFEIIFPDHFKGYQVVV
jgi:hypothetical protein